MKFRDLVRTAVSNLFRHKARTALTTVGVVVGILTIVTMVSLGIGVQHEMRAAFDTVGLESLRIYPVAEDTSAFDLFGQRQRTKLLTPELAQQLQAREGVLTVVPYLNLPTSMRVILHLDGHETAVTTRSSRPSSPGEPFDVPPRAVAGVEEPPPGGGGIVLSLDLLASLGYAREEVGDLIGREVELVLHAPRGDSQAFDFTIAGIVDQMWGSLTLSVPDRLRLLEWWYNDPDYLARRGYDELFVRTRSLNDATQMLDWLSAEGYEVESLKMMLDLASRGWIIVETMLGSVGGLALLVASIGIANTMIMAVYERTREIGILKAVGAAPGQIRSLFVLEAAFIGLLGGIAGTILGWLLGKGLNWLILEIFRWQEVPMQGTFFVVSWWLVAGALVFAALVGLLAGLYPAARAARLVPLDALRYE
ncbi:MAG: FtsX-like permease family protein [Anaerolineae bacterium]|nr:FtsX-like permease family protein [Anaerolineae bacterium]